MSWFVVANSSQGQHDKALRVADEAQARQRRTQWAANWRSTVDVVLFRTNTPRPTQIETGKGTG